MTDKFGIKIDPKQVISVHIGANPIDKLPLIQRRLTGDNPQKNRTEPIQKIRLSISIDVSEEKERLPCQE